MKPAARRRGLLLRELPDELVVYARDEHRAHCLNRTAATVFKHADGTRSVAELALLLAPQGDPSAEAVVRETLDRLAEEGLLECAPASAGGSRRQLIRRVGLGAAILLPAVASIVVPTPAEAAATCATSCAGKPPGTPCTSFPGASPCTEACVCDPGPCSLGDCSDGGGA